MPLPSSLNQNLANLLASQVFDWEKIKLFLDQGADIFTLSAATPGEDPSSLLEVVATLNLTADSYIEVITTCQKKTNDPQFFTKGLHAYLEATTKDTFDLTIAEALCKAGADPSALEPCSLMGYVVKFKWGTFHYFTLLSYVKPSEQQLFATRQYNELLQQAKQLKIKNVPVAGIEYFIRAGVKPTLDLFEVISEKTAPNLLFKLLLFCKKTGHFTPEDWGVILTKYNQQAATDITILTVLTQFSRNESCDDLVLPHALNNLNVSKIYTKEISDKTKTLYPYFRLKQSQSTPEDIAKDARTPQAKEQMIRYIKTLSPLAQLKVIDLCLQKDTQLHQFFATTRGRYATSEHRGSLKTLADMRKGLKEQIIDEIKKLEPAEQLKQLNECLTPGTALYQLFTTRRSYFVSLFKKTCDNGSTMRQLTDMRKTLIDDFKKDHNPLQGRLKCIGFDIAHGIPENLCCAITEEIMTHPIRLSNGVYCEEEALRKYLKKCSSTDNTFRCPKTLQLLPREAVFDGFDDIKLQECISFVEHKEETATDQSQFACN